jgi:hypothetical protein
MTILKVVCICTLSGEASQYNYTMSFLVPNALQDSAPPPTDASIYLEARKGFRVVAKRFPGFAGDKDFNTQAAELYSLATDAGLQVYRIHECTISLRFRAIILRVLRLEISVWIS